MKRMKRMRMKSTEIKQYATIAAVIVGAVAVYKISTGVSKGISDVGSGLGAGLNTLLGGAGQGVASAGAGVEYLGYGAGQGVSYVGQGIYELGAGVGGGLFQVGTGIQQIGGGAGYALSGANIQDIIQTVLTLGKGEASTYNQGVKLSQETAENQGQDSGASQFAKTQTSVDETTAPTASKVENQQSVSLFGLGGTPPIVQLAAAGIKALTGGSSTKTITTTQPAVTGTYQGLKISLPETTTTKPATQSWFQKAASWIVKSTILR
jgi:hypothetical protein